MPPNGNRKKAPKESATDLLMKIQQIWWRYKCHLHFELMNYNEVIYRYTLSQYNDQVVKVNVFRPIVVPKVFTKSMPPGDLMDIGRCSDDDL